MNRVLKANLEQGRHMWYLWEIVYDIRLGVADKSLILSDLRKNDHSSMFDLELDFQRTLEKYGYDSINLRETIQVRQDVESYWARTFMKVYGISSNED